MADNFAASVKDSREADRQNLMKHILDAVKQCQVRFGGRTELATEKDSCIQCLLSQYENALLHGLRKGKVWEALSSLSEPFRQVTGKVLSSLPEAELTYWPFIKEFMSPSEVQRYMTLNGIHTDSGRCRAWLRSCFNENSLERTLVSILSEKKILRQYYEDWALLLDEERSSTLPVMARGLGSIVFAIEIHGSHLNAPMRQPTFPRTNAALIPIENKAKSKPLPVIADQGKESSNQLTVPKRKKKKKVKQVTINNIEEPEDEPIGNSNQMHQQYQPRESTVSNSVAYVEESKKKPTVEKSKSIQSHRRSVSLESSELIQKKSNSSKFKLDGSSSFEVPDFRKKKKTSVGALYRNELKSPEESNTNNELMQQRDKGPSETRTDVEESTVENSSLMSKISSFSTSFKTSFSSGVLQRIGSKDSENIADKTDILDDAKTENDSSNLVDDNVDAVSKNLKLEISCGSDRKEISNDAEASQQITDSIDQTSGVFLTPETSDVKEEDKKVIDSVTVKTRSRCSSNDLDKILGPGDSLSANSNAVEKMDSVLNLKTPPSTPADSLQPSKDSKLHNKDDRYPTLGLSKKIDVLDVIENKADPDKGQNQLKDLDETTNSNTASNDTASKCPDADETLSVDSSNAESVPEDLDVLRPVGYESEKFSDALMAYDRQSSQAANDALQLLKTSSEMHHSFDVHQPVYDGIPSALGPFVDVRPASSEHENDLSTTDLKQAILATVKRKDEVEENNRFLQLALDEEREYSLNLKTELDELQDKHSQSSETNEKRIDDLSRENEVLRNQLKKYVAAVQLLKRENKNISKETNEAIGTLRGYIEDSGEMLPPPPKERTNSEMDSVYEDKLVQMAEFHGELMEFHESLQRELLKKQNQIFKMKEELIVLRGPLPCDLGVSATETDPFGVKFRPLINIWIPSVFVKGKGSDAHHLYQVYVRIGDEEWNIYRRYSQFHRMHITCCREYPDVEKFNFPPKKLIGKKDLKFVEGRRRKLQEYIRRLINLYIAKNTTLSHSPNKENLEKSLPFFDEKSNENGKKKKESTKSKANKSSVYTGL